MGWKLNPFTGKLDYHNGLGAYQLFTSFAQITAYLIDRGIMVAYVAPPAVKGGIEFEDRGDIEWQDTEGIEFEDRET